MPIKCDYFSEQGLKILDVQVGAKACIIKTISESDEICMYGIPRVYSPERREQLEEIPKDVEEILKQSRDMLGFESVDHSINFN